MKGGNKKNYQQQRRRCEVQKKKDQNQNNAQDFILYRYFILITFEKSLFRCISNIT